MNNEQHIYSFIKFKYFVLQISKVCDIKRNKFYVGREIKRLYLVQVKTTK